MKEILAQRLKECRKVNSLTQMEAATHCDIAEEAYQNCKLMKREPRIEIQVRKPIIDADEHPMVAKERVRFRFYPNRMSLVLACA